MSAVSLSGITVRFNAGTELELAALDDVSLDIEAGSFTIVVGSNGSGKSTLLSVLAGEIAPERGTITIDGIDVTRLAVHKRAPFIGRVFQDPFAGTAPGLTVAENIAIAAMRGHRRLLRHAVREDIREQITTRVASFGMGLEQRLDTPMHSLSGGQRQALTLLMATWNRPRVLLLDEHTAALDPKSADRIASISADVIAAEGLTAVMVTHSMQQASHFGDRLVLMHRGIVALDLRGAEKRALRPHALLARFESLRRQDALTPDAAEMLRNQYI
jgi:putative tryptophan/tyrosine transport system ATP-binding protein